jgi:hypothetical protein
MGFIRKKENELAFKLLKWQYARLNLPLPDDASLKNRAEKLVDDAHKIAREKGRNVFDIMKELVNDLKRK